MEINVGIAQESRKKIAHGLAKLLADTYTLYLKTQNFHWNVTGPLFSSLHQTFENQYKELAEATDSIAERIRALGYQSPASFREFLDLTSVEEAKSEAISADQMVRELVGGNETVVRTARQIVDQADSVKDEATIDLLTERIEVHEKAAWMLRSMLERQPPTEQIA